VVLALAGGIVGTIIGLVQADEARRAEAHRAESERLAKDTAEKRLAQLEKGMDIIGAIFENLDPRSEDKEGRSLRAMLGDRLEQAAAVLEGDSVGDPLVVARLQDRLGQTYLGLGDTAKAEALFARALTTRQDLLGPEHPQTLASMHSQAMAFKAAGKLPQAIERFEQVRDAQIKELGADHPDTLTTLNNLGVAYRFAGKLPEAIALLKQVGEARADKLGADDPDTLITLNWLAWAYRDDGRLDDAIVLHRHVLDARVKRLGRDDPDTLGTMDELALAYRAADNPSAAIALYEQARDARMKRYGLDHPRTLTTLNNLAWTYRIAGRTSEAIALFEHIRDIRVQKLEAENLDALTTLGDLAWAYANAGKREQAISVFQRAAVGLEKRKFAHKDAGAIIGRMCECQEYLKKHAEAEVWRRKWLAVLKEKSGADSIDYAEASAALGWNLVQQQKWVEVEMVLRPCLSVRQHNEADAWTTFDTQLLLGTALVGQHKYADAEPHLLQGYQGLKAREAKMPDHARGDLTRDLEQLVNLYDSAGMQAEADRWRKELEQRKTK
jgi:tetratricopeptide (TPR) repeat protein